MIKNKTRKIKIIATVNKEDTHILKLAFTGSVNLTDFTIVYELSKAKLTITELSKKIKIAPVNLWKHLNKLKKLGIIDLPNVSKGKKKYPQILKSPFTDRMINLHEDFIMPVQKKGGKSSLPK